jgi:hypothetical protein
VAGIFTVIHKYKQKSPRFTKSFVAYDVKTLKVPYLCGNRETGTLSATLLATRKGLKLKFIENYKVIHSVSVLTIL